LSSKLSSRSTCVWFRGYFRGGAGRKQENAGVENLHEIDALFLDSCLIRNVVIARQKVPHPCLLTRARVQHTCLFTVRTHPILSLALASQSLLDRTYFPARTAQRTSSMGSAEGFKFAMRLYCSPSGTLTHFVREPTALPSRFHTWRVHTHGDVQRG
jgi:hypothetical protein